MNIPLKHLIPLLPHVTYQDWDKMTSYRHETYAHLYNRSLAYILPDYYGDALIIIYTSLYGWNATFLEDFEYRDFDYIKSILVFNVENDIP